MDTRKSLEDEVLGWLDESGDTSTTRTNVRNALRQAHLSRLTENDWPFLLWPEPQRFALQSGVKNYALHSEYWRPFYFWDVTQQQELNERPLEKVRPAFTDEQFKFVLHNRQPVERQPASASTLTFVSDHAGDNGQALGVYLRGMTASGMRQETINPNGLTPVESTYTYLAGGILQLSKFGTWVGDLTVTAGSTSVLTLGLDETARTYQQIRLLWTPTSADTIEYQFFRTPNPLDHDESIPDIPFPHSGILVWDALLLLAAYDGQLDNSRRAIWQGKQAEMDLALRQAFLDGSSLSAEPREIRDIEDD